MTLENFFRRRRPTSKIENDLPDLWTKCPNCKEAIYNKDLEANLWVCPKCGYHFRLDAVKRMNILLDKGYKVISGDILPMDPLDFVDIEPYTVRIERAQKKTGRTEAILSAVGTIEEVPCVAVAMDFSFSGGSMGSVVGEEIALAAEFAAKNNLPLILVAASGGARMQESAFSLMQMAKTTIALENLSKKSLPYISILTDPTTGGVTASFATIADIIIAEPNSLIGFAGPRVIQQTIRQNLPEGFQRSEFLLEHGMLDDVIDRRRHRNYLKKVLDILCSGDKL